MLQRTGILTAPRSGRHRHKRPPSDATDRKRPGQAKPQDRKQLGGRQARGEERKGLLTMGTTCALGGR